ncbi:GTP-binding protein [Caproiciproducens sp. MSJ-32]|uniref:GTP-binding protein n=1 Tax=Caproiciproducens sp. MSJ-32 TaxID=2841527 RepID=UPI001C1086FD|nr:GTP-binding protein [Caproiciproducens sp. MSJ-32]MBU5454812.1 GTP-binding protein [Caproiciproducens sp. MSJ-32]
MKVKVDIYSGFLGAGKTFLMKKLINEGVYENNIAIIENEFGEVSIDGDILRESNIEVKEINSGCICCEVTGDFKEGVLEIIDKYNPDRILIEPSGVAKLTDILKIFKDNRLLEKVKLENIITVIDPEKFNMYIENFKSFYEDQIRNTGKIVLSRTQKIDSYKLDEIIGEIRKINSRVVIISEPWNNLRAEEILESNSIKKFIIKEGRFSKGLLNSKKSNDKKANEVFETIAIYPTSKLSKNELISKFNFISKSKSYGDILRAKGIVKLIDGTSGQFDFVKDEFVMREIKGNDKNVISIIGLKLNKEELGKLFK